MGCPNLIVVTDHEPLKGQFGDRDHSKIPNPPIIQTKRKNPQVQIYHPTLLWEESDDMDDWVKSTTLLSSFGASDNVALISPDAIRAAGYNDLQYKRLIETIQNGFEKTCSLTALEIREYWEVRHHLSVDDGLVLLYHRIVIPTYQRANVLRSLHSAHQGEVGMKARANESVYWPGMNASICNTRASCICTGLTLDIEFHGKPALTHEYKASHSSNDFPRWDEVVCRQSHIPEMLKSSEAYGCSTVGEDRHLSAAIRRDVPSLPGIWLWREWDDIWLYLRYFACVLSRVCTCCLVDMSDKCVHGSLISTII